MEIVDHHRIGSIETSNLITFKNVPVGCTCTIIYGLYHEYGIEIPRILLASCFLQFFQTPLHSAPLPAPRRDIVAIRSFAEIYLRRH